MSDTEHNYVSEDESAGYASPVMDIIAALAISALSIWIMIQSVALKVPDAIATAPGLLPFITAGMLLFMAVILGVVAVRRHFTAPVPIANDMPPAMARTMLLTAIMIAYVAALEFVKFETVFVLGGFRIDINAFEPISIVVLTTIFRIFWTPRLWACLLVSFVWIMTLSLVFRKVMSIPMPS
jgi:hypothetical protein